MGVEGSSASRLQLTGTIAIGIDSAPGCLEDLIHTTHRSGLVAALTGNYRSGRIGELYKVVIENLSMIRSISDLAATHSLSRIGILAAEPVGIRTVVEMVLKAMTDP